jgi:hypothetical protein
MQSLRVPTLLAVAAAAAFATAAVPAQSHKAHVHGVMALDIALDGPVLLVQLVSPQDSVIGHERRPKPGVETTAAAAVLSLLRDAPRWLKPDAAAGCTAGPVKLLPGKLQGAPKPGETTGCRRARPASTTNTACPPSGRGKTALTGTRSASSTCCVTMRTPRGSRRPAPPTGLGAAGDVDVHVDPLLLHAQRRDLGEGRRLDAPHPPLQRRPVRPSARCAPAARPGPAARRWSAARPPPPAAPGRPVPAAACPGRPCLRWPAARAAHGRPPARARRSRLAGRARPRGHRGQRGARHFSSCRRRCGPAAPPPAPSVRPAPPARSLSRAGGRDEALRASCSLRCCALRVCASATRAASALAAGALQVGLRGGHAGRELALRALHRAWAPAWGSAWPARRRRPRCRRPPADAHQATASGADTV